MSGSRWRPVGGGIGFRGGGGLAEVGVWRGKGLFKLQRPQIGHETHVWRWGRRRDHTNLIFLKRGNTDNKELEVNDL